MARLLMGLNRAAKYLRGRQLRVLAIKENTTVQALVGEALDMLMRARSKHPFGER